MKGRSGGSGKSRMGFGGEEKETGSVDEADEEEVPR